MAATCCSDCASSASRCAWPRETSAVAFTRSPTNSIPWCSSWSAASASAATAPMSRTFVSRSEEHTSELQSQSNLVCRLLLEKKYENGKAFVKGTPSKAVTIQEIAMAAFQTNRLPKGMEGGLEATTFFDPSNFVWPFGAHICVVEVDAETGATRILRYVAVDDCGTRINPMVVDGQLHGGIAHGIGQALFEEGVYDGAGQLQTGSLVD